MGRPRGRGPEMLVLDMRGSELGGELINALVASLGGTVEGVTDTASSENASGAADATSGAEIPEPGPLGALLMPPAVNLGLEEVVAFKVTCGRCGERGYAEDTREISYLGWTASVGTNFDGVLDSEITSLCPKCSLGYENWMLAVE